MQRGQHMGSASLLSRVLQELEKAPSILHNPPQPVRLVVVDVYLRVPFVPV